MAIEIPEEETIESLERIFVKGRNESVEQVTMAVKDGYKTFVAFVYRDRVPAKR